MTDSLIGGAMVLLFVAVFAFVNVSKAKIGWSFINNKHQEDNYDS